MIIDARGQGCPKPVIMAEEAFSKIDEGIVEIIVDNEGSAKNLARFAVTNAFYSETVQEDKHWRVKIVKGYPCEESARETAKEPEKEIFLVIATDTM
ncbi:MAG TPA: sulfurtransferase-like selenium metabolism protein YedF, partial [Nitrospiraceae bacterium]|nr:sulfurtransferase-like selenium metabolism protein YedF [Nitrospiraceae bacterium]